MEFCFGSRIIRDIHKDKRVEWMQERMCCRADFEQNPCIVVCMALWASMYRLTAMRGCDARLKGACSGWSLPPLLVLSL